MHAIKYQDYIIKQGVGSEIDEFLQLHGKVFGTWPEKIEREIFDWKFTRNPFLDETPFIVAKKDGNIVGGVGFVSFPMRINGNQLLGLHPADAMVHSKHRRKGIFNQMLDMGVKSFSQDETLLFVTSQVSNTHQALLKYGWKEAKNSVFIRFQSNSGIDLKKDFHLWQNFLNILCTILGHLPVGGRFPEEQYEISRYDTIPSKNLERLYLKDIPNEIHAVRSEQFYNWRTADPLQTYTTYTASEEGEPLASIVLSKSKDDEVGLIRDILPFNKNHDSAIQILLQQILDDTEIQKIRCWPPQSQRRNLIRAGFFPINKIPFAPKNLSNIVVDFCGDILNNCQEIDDSEIWELQLMERDC